MSLRRELETVWTQLRGQNPSRADAITEVTLSGLRGIDDLRVPLPFPVTVLAGPNGCGKSTVLFALACAYRVPGAKLREFTPATLFPNFVPKQDAHRSTRDDVRSARLEFTYVADGKHMQMIWRRIKKGWNRSFAGRQRASQPVRGVYLRTLANLSNPAEVRSVLQMAQKNFESETIDSAQIAFAQRILAYRYATMSRIATSTRDLLFVRRGDEQIAGGNESAAPTYYSEFHMSAGERAILRLSMSISTLPNTLVLIDEVEAGLHPQIQQLLMLELQRLALRNRLQIVVTTHSPAVLETVPPEARVFLERTDQGVVRREPYRDLVQKALYGQSLNTLSILCEDEEAEGFVRGMLDDLGPRIDLLQNDIQVGRDTGKDEFPRHLETLGRFRKLRDVIFVLDGDGRDIGPIMDARAQRMGQNAQILFLPGNEPPEIWAWDRLKAQAEEYAPFFGISVTELSKQLVDQERVYASATDKPTEIAKNRLYSLVENAARNVPDLLREMGRIETHKQRGEVKEVADRLQDFIQDWRTQM